MAESCQKNNNVVTLFQNTVEIPTDLMPLRKLAQKYGFTYSLLYKIIVRENKIPHYQFGKQRKIMVSENTFVKWVNACLVPAKEVV